MVDAKIYKEVRQKIEESNVYQPKRKMYKLGQC